MDSTTSLDERIRRHLDHADAAMEGPDPDKDTLGDDDDDEEEDAKHPHVAGTGTT